MTDRPALVLRAATGPGVGVGHLARCLWLAAAWSRRGGTATILTEEAPPPWNGRAAALGVALAGLDGLPGAVEAAEVVVVDGYGLGADARALAGRRPLLVIDDHATAGPAGADLVVDQNLGAEPRAYAPVPALVGPRYALLPADRREVAPRPPAERRLPVRRLVVSLGGLVPPERRAQAEAVLAAAGVDDLEVVVLDGSQDLAAVLPGVDLAFAAAGSTVWDLCRHAVPSVLVTVADNQIAVARALSTAGAAVHAGPLGGDVRAAGGLLRAVLDDPDRRESMAVTAGALVDGWGADRVVSRLRAEALVLRPVVEGDADLLRAWRNDPATVAASFDSRPVDEDEHRRWLAGVLADPDRVHDVALDGSGRPVGAVRFDDLGGGQAEIGLTVAPDRRGEGWAATLIDAGSRHLASIRGSATVVARVKADNQRSRSAFLAADFDPAAPGDVPGPDGVHEYIRTLAGR